MLFKKLILTSLLVVSINKAMDFESSMNDEQYKDFERYNSEISVKNIPTRFIYVDEAGLAHQIQRAFVDPILRNIPSDKLEKVLNHFAFRVGRLDNGEYALHAHVRGVGGFLLTGVIVYQTTRLVGHSAIWVSAGTVVVGAFVTGGPPAAGAAYLASLSAIPAASAVVESTSLTLGVAASWIPGLP